MNRLLKKCSALLLTGITVLSAVPLWFGLSASAAVTDIDYTVLSSSGGFSSGSGTEADPFIIGSAEDMLFFAESVNEGIDYDGLFVALGNDVCLADISNESSRGKSVNGSTDLILPTNYIDWKPVGYAACVFSGTFDGRGHSVKGLYLKDDCVSLYFGLFGALKNAVVKDLTVSGYINAGDYTGAVAGRAYDSALIRCVNNCNIEGNDYTGGITGYSSNTLIYDCENNGKVSGNMYTGGVVSVFTTPGGESFFVYLRHTSNTEVRPINTAIDRFKFVRNPDGGADLLVTSGPTVTPQPLPRQQ